MFALITSHLCPKADSKQSFNIKDRFIQTRQTITSLKQLGFTKIILADNSFANWDRNYRMDFADVIVYTFDHPKFTNYGISELYMLREVVQALPRNEEFVKISARYTTNINLLDKIANYDIVCKRQISGKRMMVSTRYYGVKNSEIYEDLLKAVLNEIYAHQSRIVGPRSLLRIIIESIQTKNDTTNYFDPMISIEHGFAKAISKKFKNTLLIDHLGIRGYIKGNLNDFISE